MSEISTKHGTFKSEGKSSVMRDTVRKIRIQIIDYNPYVFIVGIFYKDSKGVSSNTDDIVQKQYEKRIELLDIIKELPKDELDIFIKTCIESYRKFIKNLTVIVYGDNISESDSLRELVKKFFDDYSKKTEQDLEGGKKHES